MDAKDFGDIVLVVNEFGNLSGEIYIGNITGELRIHYTTTKVPQLIEPHELSNLLAVKINEYSEELGPIVQDRHEDDAPAWRERNLKSYIGYLRTAQHRLSMLTTYQAEKAKESE